MWWAFFLLLSPPLFLLFLPGFWCPEAMLGLQNIASKNRLLGWDFSPYPLPPLSKYSLSNRILIAFSRGRLTISKVKLKVGMPAIKDCLMEEILESIGVS